MSRLVNFYKSKNHLISAEREYYRANMMDKRRPSIGKDLLKFAFNAALVTSGLYLLSNFSMFLSNHFTKKGLTKKQLILMDQHNSAHIMFGEAHSHGQGMLGVLGVDEREIDRSRENTMFDEQIATLPDSLKHKHT